jgi:aspartyl protease family protein
MVVTSNRGHSMLRKLLILGVFAGGSASVPILYQSNPHMFETVMERAAGGGTATQQAPADMTMAAVQPQRQQPLGRSVLIPADGRGHFLAAFKVNGRQVNAMVDTGATVVALNLSTARKAGISLSSGDFTQQVETANGKARVAVVEIADLAIGRITLKNVQAVVLEDKALQTNLIGMSFLGRLDKYQVEDGNLMLAQ